MSYPSERRKPSLTRSVIAGLWRLRYTKGSAEVLEYALGPKGRALRRIDRRALRDLRRAEAWLDETIAWQEKKKPGMVKRLT